MLGLGCGAATAQDLPQFGSLFASRGADTKTPAKALFGAATSPAPFAAEAIGTYSRGCLAGAVALPVNSSHQIGFDADIWLTPMPDRRLSRAERENMTAVSMLRDPLNVDRDVWTPTHTRLIELAASYPEVERIFVHPAIKQALCDQDGRDRAWLSKVRS